MKQIIIWTSSLIAVLCLLSNFYLFGVRIISRLNHNEFLVSFVVIYSKLLAVLFSLLIILFRRNKTDLLLGTILLLLSISIIVLFFVKLSYK